MVSKMSQRRKREMPLYQEWLEKIREVLKNHAR